MAELIQLAEKLAGATAATGLILVLFGGYKGWWIYGRELTEERAAHARELTRIQEENAVLRTERDEYKALLFRTLRVTDLAVKVAQGTNPG